MISNFKNSISLFVGVLFVILIAILQFKSFNIKNNTNPYPISWDVYGYYLFLPATFIYNDLGLENNEWINKTREEYKPSTTFYQVTQGEGGKKTIVYNIGYAFIYAPGFFIANGLATSLGYDKDGFSKPYQVSLILTAFIFSLIGIFMFRKICLRFFPDKISALLMVFILIGSNYFFQSIYDGIMPHNLLFTINCFIIWYTIKWHEKRTLANILLLGFFIGFATICRPTELLWILLPLLWKINSLKEFIQKLKSLIKNYIHLILAIIVFIGIIFIQFFYYKYTSGNYFILNLHNEGFSFLDPYTFDFLFSYKKGWLLYTPIMLFGIFGFYFLYRQNKSIWLALFSYFIINLYVTSSWECWWYATSFSQRPMVETYAMMLFPLGFFLKWQINQKTIVKYSLFSVLLLLVLFNLFQTWQFNKGIIHGERMTKEYYWSIFGLLEPNPSYEKYLSVDRFSISPINNNDYYKNEIFFNDFDDLTENIVDSISISGNKSFLLSQEVPFSPTFEVKYTDLTHKSYLWVNASVWVYLLSPYTESNSSIVVSVESKGKSYKYESSNYEKLNIDPFKWSKIELNFLTPYIRHKDDIIKAYFWNMGNKPVIIDDFKVTVYEPKIDYN